ncbi:MAG: hypothetical protein M0R02_09710 [Bacteroidales bacterium]|nr:hypothetical protein [Bacteroidales bacterium]
MDTVNLRTIIAAAERHEQQTGELSLLLRGRLHSLHGAITPRASDLLDFVRRYVARLPDILDAMRDLGARQGTEDSVEDVIDSCCELFARPPELLRGHQGLNGAMNSAYMAHRLIEETSDHHQVSRGQALLPLDSTRSNLVIHQLIGESFANQLDSAVSLLTSELISRWPPPSPATGGEPSPTLLTELLQRWPCLQDSLAGDLFQLPASIH